MALLFFYLKFQVTAINRRLRMGPESPRCAVDMLNDI